MSRIKMVTVCLFLFTPFSLACTRTKVPKNPSEFRIALNITYGESSKDSHSTTYRIDFDGSKVSYYGPYGECERGRCKHKELQFGMDDGEIRKLEVLLVEQKLLTSFNEIKKNQDIGNWIEASLSISRNQEKWNTSIEGMTGTWHTDKEDFDISDKARKKLEGVTAMQRLFTDFAIAYLPSAH